MINITSPNNFTTTLWKNGKGTTTELAISANSSIDKFGYRLSIADVSENGMFSNFDGVMRKLILLRGNGIILTHNNDSVDTLQLPLTYAIFDGGSSTLGELIDGPIVDFNLMYDEEKYQNKLTTSVDKIETLLDASDITFIYSPTKSFTLINLIDKSQQEIAANHLLELTDATAKHYQLVAEQVIIVQLNKMSAD